LGQLALVAPQHLARSGVQRQHLTVGGGDKHHAVVDDRRRLMTLVDPGRNAPDGD
jgi:hypothetical protein